MNQKSWFDMDEDGELIAYNISVYNDRFKVTKRIEMTLIKQAIIPLMLMLDTEAINEFIEGNNRNIF